jgi:hypothetical protein
MRFDRLVAQPSLIIRIEHPAPFQISFARWRKRFVLNAFGPRLDGGITSSNRVC